MFLTFIMIVFCIYTDRKPLYLPTVKLLKYILSHNKMPDAIQNTFVVDFTHTQPTRANDVGLLNLPLVKTTSFGKHSIRYNALLSWNLVQSMLPIKLFDLEDIKTDLKKCLIAS